MIAQCEALTRKKPHTCLTYQLWLNVSVIFTHSLFTYIPLPVKCTRGAWFWEIGKKPHSCTLLKSWFFLISRLTMRGAQRRFFCYVLLRFFSFL